MGRPTVLYFVYSIIMYALSSHVVGADATILVIFVSCLYSVAAILPVSDDPVAKESWNEYIEHYFLEGFQYLEIISFLSNLHGIVMSLSTLKRRLRRMGLWRKAANAARHDSR